ncbi:uncharacterized protein LOC122267555 [Penaeus japonicus]|uniref:uncharacterized protein LOC122267555 n=1 Tax=Penaeus japonicus TaxID=27405 RepID=UPI001C7156CC|nr:uncharacterized protein LOC122267555 [Penaeus japonicus]
MSSRGFLRLQFMGIGTMLMGMLVMVSAFLFFDCRSPRCSWNKKFISTISLLWIVSGASIFLIAYILSRRDGNGSYREIPSSQVIEGAINPVPGLCQYQQDTKGQMKDPPPPYSSQEKPPPYGSSV